MLQVKKTLKFTILHMHYVDMHMEDNEIKHQQRFLDALERCLGILGESNVVFDDGDKYDAWHKERPDWDLPVPTETGNLDDVLSDPSGMFME
jgi:hypothetical protein